MKNIVVCCDGTGSEYGRDEENTNVVRLFELLVPDGDRQISYYDPGIGTYSPLRNPLRSWLEKQLMMASGRGITLNVQKAYKYLMDYFEPGDRIVKSDDLVLIDAGGSIFGYTADVTRTYPAEERFTPKQQAIYDLVLAAESEGISKCRIGTEWHDVHRAAAAVLAQGLRDLGILKGEIDGLLDSGAIALFFPHGIGHMTGLGVRDVGGHAPGRGEVQPCCGVRVRIDFPLEENFLMTVEPGIYFVPAILDDPVKRERFQDSVDWESLNAWRSVGGVRIEDNVLITASGPHVITAEIPK